MADPTLAPPPTPTTPSDISQLLASSAGRKVLATILAAALGYLVELRVQVGNMSYRLERIEQSVDELVRPERSGRLSRNASAALVTPP